MRIRNSYANVTSSLALVVALGGTTAWAVDGPLAGQNTVGSEDIIGNEVKSGDIANGRIFDVDLADEAVTTAKVKTDTLTGADINESTLAKVPAAVRADTAGGLGPPEAWREIAPGTPNANACGNPNTTGVFCDVPTLGPEIDGSWHNVGGQHATAAFYKDQLGIVHLKGLVRNVHAVHNSSPHRIFRLPPSYRPTTWRVFPSIGDNSLGLDVASGRIDIEPNGLVSLVEDCEDAASQEHCSASPRHVTLDGISFRPDG